MLARDHIYTVHEKPDLADAADRVVLVREGFSLWAFVFTILWLLAHQLWLMSAGYLVLLVALLKIGALLHIPQTSLAVLNLGLQLWLGFTARDAQRAALARRGFALTGVLCGDSPLMVERRYYDHFATA